MAYYVFTNPGPMLNAYVLGKLFVRGRPTIVTSRLTTLLAKKKGFDYVTVPGGISPTPPVDTGLIELESGLGNILLESGAGYVALESQI